MFFKQYFLIYYVANRLPGAELSNKRPEILIGFYVLELGLLIIHFLVLSYSIAVLIPLFFTLLRISDLYNHTNKNRKMKYYICFFYLKYKFSLNINRIYDVTTDQTLKIHHFKVINQKLVYILGL